MDLQILYEDAHVLAVSKPAGLLTQGLIGKELTLEDAARRHVDRQRPASVYLGTVHRLDRPVSGVVVYAKTPRAARRLSSQFEGRSVVKEYEAIVEAIPDRLPPEAGQGGFWEDWLSERTDTNGVVRRLEEGTAQGRLARTRYRVEEARDDAAGRLALLTLLPETGRTHQLRAQASWRGWPILGDRIYGATRPFPSGIALHARAITFEHPSHGRPVTIRSPRPASWAGLG